MNHLKNRISTGLSLLILIVVPSLTLANGIENLRETSKAFASVATEVSPSVVFIQVEGKKSTQSNYQHFQSPFGESFPFGDDFFKHFFGDRLPNNPQFKMPRNEQIIRGQGSGFVFSSSKGLLSKKTFIMTNNHVIENAETITVKFQDGQEYEAKVTGTDPQSDVAVIEIKASGIPALKLADSSSLDVGEWVVAIGNPFGLNHTLTVGVVSAKGRTSVGINDYEDFIQTDAAINPGNSGGPLVNLDGDVVGINTAIFSRSGGYMGIGFAIPSSLAQQIVDQLIDDGEVTRGFLGVLIQPLTKDLADSFGIDSREGILISEVHDDTPAEKAGFESGDVIIELEGKPVSDVGSFRNRISLTPPGNEVFISVIRDGKRKKLSVSIGKLDQDKVVSGNPTQDADEIGLTVQTVTPNLAKQFDVKANKGVIVTEVKSGSVAALAGIKAGTVILEVNQTKVNLATEFKRAMKNGRNDQALLLIRVNGNQRFVVLNW